jgi:hypothetical protein
MHFFRCSQRFCVLLRSFGLGIVAAALLVTSGCDVFSSQTSTYTVSGTIVNATERGVDNAEITFREGESTPQTTTANDSGYYEIDGLSEGDYDVSVSASGYEETTFSVSVTSNTTVPERELPGPAEVSGTVRDAVTGEAVADAEVAFTFGGESADTSRSSADLIATTSSEGSYSISGAPTGVFLCVIRVPGYIPAIIPEIEFEEGTNDLGSASTSETLAEGQVRIVLEWGENPSDLDSHLTGPAEDGGRFHVYYANQEPSGAGANLDRDDVSSYGPETTTITEFRSGTYRYSVFNFSNQSDDGAVGIAESPARVTVYDSNGQQASYTAPSADAGDGNTWRVLEIAGGSTAFDDNGGDTFGYYDADDSGDVDTFTDEAEGILVKDEGKTQHTPRQRRLLRRIFDRPVDAF